MDTYNDVFDESIQTFIPNKRAKVHTTCEYVLLNMKIICFRRDI